MPAYTQALQLVCALQLPALHMRLGYRSRVLSAASNYVELDVYEPRGRDRGTIVVVHGMTVQGKRDPRIIALARALCAAGFRVVAPEIPSIRALNIEASQIGVIAQVLDAIASHRGLAPAGRVSVLAPSFSGALVLSAATLPIINARIDAVCAIGAFSHVQSVMRYLLADDAADTYGRYIVLKKLLPAAQENSAGLMELLDVAIRDNLSQSSYAKQVNKDELAPPALILPQRIEVLAPGDKQQAEQLFADAAFRLDILAQAQQVLSEELNALDVGPRLQGLQAKVFLLHGREDKVIPYEQSEMLHGKLRELDKPSNLLVSPLLSHGDAQIRLSMVADIHRIVRGFAFFLS